MQSKIFSNNLYLKLILYIFQNDTGKNYVNIQKAKGKKKVTSLSCVQKLESLCTTEMLIAFLKVIDKDINKHTFLKNIFLDKWLCMYKEEETEGF